MCLDRLTYAWVWGIARQVDSGISEIIRMDQPFPLGLTLADGTRWLIRAGDEPVRSIVTALGSAMRLQSANSGRELLAVVHEGGGIPPANLRGSGIATCFLSSPTNRDMLTIGMMHLSLAIASEVSRRGGVLLHGALAELGPHPRPLSRWTGEGCRGDGVLLAGPGTVGKTTASNRLSPPWRSLCDDTTLVVRDAAGQYWAHPWPTWSRFYDVDGNPGPGGSWDVQRAVPLRAIFFLSQSPEDRTSPLHLAQVTAMLMDSVQQASGTMTRRMDEVTVQALFHEQLQAVKDLAQAIPAYRLDVSLTGEFWKEIERVLPKDDSGRMKDEDSSLTVSSLIPHPSSLTLHPSSLFVVYTGPSMNPTLRMPDLLEVRAYEGSSIQSGDVIYFPSPEDGKFIVHRVMRVTPDGIHTRGDNNSQDDPYCLKPEAIIGRVIAAQRGQRRRRVAGGGCGVWVGTYARLWRFANIWSGRLFHKAYRAIAWLDILPRLLPPGWRPRVVCFRSRWQIHLKLMVGSRVIGQYDGLRSEWNFRRPFRLWVDVNRLPKPNLKRAGQWERSEEQDV